jgi:ADP-ribosylglycohydrolase
MTGPRMESVGHVRMLESLAGLSVGDAFGEHFLSHMEDIPRRVVGDPPWGWTDDTEMALSLVSVLLKHQVVHQQDLARAFVEGFDPRRRYGGAMLFEYIPRLQAGGDWREAASGLFDGAGSYGNGAAMRVAPLGARFADDLDRSFIEAIVPHVPLSEVRRRLVTLHDQLGPRAAISQVAQLVGDGSFVSSQDTVPLCIWAAGRHLDDYEEALWQTVSVLGDMDTNCAIVGGIVAARVGAAAIPADWITAREPLPGWAIVSGENESRAM